MSIQAELIRRGMRWLSRPGPKSTDTIGTMRRQTARFTRMSPRPAWGTENIETTLGGVPATITTRRTSRPERHVLFLHGGGYIAGSPRLYRHITWRFADATEARIAALDYRLAPEHPYPAALEDAVSAWHALVAEEADPSNIVIMGDSAGGGLALALGLRLRDAGSLPPAAIVAICPWTDLALTGNSMINDAVPFAGLHVENVRKLATAYLGGADPHEPYASPLYADLRGLPPTLIQVSGDERLLDDSVRIAERMKQAGCDVELEIWPGLPHVWHAFATILPEARQAIRRIGEFVREKIERQK
jgi:acetyl esterase/lipase